MVPSNPRIQYWSYDQNIWVLWIMSQIFLFAKICNSGWNRALWIWSFWKNSLNLWFEQDTNRHNAGSTGRQIHFRAQIRIEWLILRILCPKVIFRRNALVGFIFGFEVPLKINIFSGEHFLCILLNKSLRIWRNYFKSADISWQYNASPQTVAWESRPY